MKRGVPELFLPVTDLVMDMILRHNFGRLDLAGIVGR